MCVKEKPRYLGTVCVGHLAKPGGDFFIQSLNASLGLTMCTALLQVFFKCNRMIIALHKSIKGWLVRAYAHPNDFCNLV